MAIKVKRKKGFISNVINTEGTKKSLTISENLKGWVIRYSSSGKIYKQLGNISEIEKKAVALAKKGHKSIRFMD